MPHADDLALLRAFEPVVRYTKGEFFFPVSAERYVARAALWGDSGTGDDVLRAEPGTLTLDDLGRGSATEGIGEALSGIVTGAAGRDRVHIPLAERPKRLHGGSRLAAVGVLARLVDALNRLSLVFRGSVPGGSAARSFLLQRDYLDPTEPTYYGRVVRDEHWIVLQYWYFYAFNNWRSGFGGVNEHEADWEQVTIYLDGTGEVDDDGLPHARWVVFSAHDETGDDLRRRWDDPDLALVAGRHPVVFAGAGSHSGAYLPGDYLITIPAPKFGGLVMAARWFGRLVAPWSAPDASGGIGIPYVDYARGDGRVIGAGGDPWHAVVVDETTGWVRDFRGLWGHDTRDRLGGERGPAGPRYERDGTVRESWADPVGWAGLAKVAPNAEVEVHLLLERAERLATLRREAEEDLESGREALRVRSAGLAPRSPELRALQGEEARLLSLRLDLTRLRDEYARVCSVVAAPSEPVAPHAHLSHRRLPLTPLKGVRSRILTGWAVISTPVILIVIGSIAAPWIEWDVPSASVVLVVGMLLVEGFLRSKFLVVVGRVAAAFGIFVALYFMVVDWRVVLAALFGGAGALLLVVNLRDALKR